MKHRWQFSLRALLLLTAAVAGVLAVAVNMPGLFRGLLLVAAFTLMFVVVLQSANFATSERRPRLAALSWLLLGVFFWIYAVLALELTGIKVHGSHASRQFGQVTGIVMAVCGVVSCYRAFRALRRPMPRPNPAADDRQ